MRARSASLGAACLVLGACVWETELPEEARAVAIDPARELVVTDVAALAEPLSFRQALGDLASDFEVERYRLVAVANRTDLASEPDRVADGGEGRLVYALDGEPVSVIFEYAQDGSAREWAARWHAVKEPSDLVAIRARFGRLARVRVADARSGAVVFRELRPASGALVEAPELPVTAGGETCATCHDQTETGFQIEPASGRLSRFLTADMPRREAWMQLTLAKATSATSPLP